jgi:hypothetical protein
VLVSFTTADPRRRNISAELRPARGHPPRYVSSFHVNLENTMHDRSSDRETVRHVPFKQEGWGIALLVVLLALGAAATATLVHKRTYKAPTDVRFQAAGSNSAHD